MARYILVGFVAVLGLVAGQAHAYSFTYVDVDPVFTHVSAGESVSGHFNLKDPGDDCFFGVCDRGGFDPITQDVVAARLSFVFFDFDFGKEEVSILLGPDLLANPHDVLQEESFEGYVFFLHLERFDANVEVLAELSETGELDWMITAPAPASTSTAGYGGHHSCHKCCKHKNGNDFYVKVAKLEAAIPEPSAALLFAVGFGVVGVGARQRRRS